LNAREVVREVIIGVLEGLIYMFLYLYLLPALVSYLGVLAGQPSLSVAYSYPVAYPVAYIGVFESLSVAARILRKTVFSPIFRSLLALIGLVVILYVVGTVMPGGVISSSYSAGQAKYSLSLDVYPLVLLFVVSLVLPGVILPFIDYFVYER